jgi:hypothetical protein
MCAHPVHARRGERRVVDVSDQVRLERELSPKGSVYLAYTERVVQQVSDLAPGPEREDAIVRILTGSPAPGEAPVMLVSEGAGVDRAAGLYEADELGRSAPLAQHLLQRFASPNLASPSSDDLVIVDEVDGVDETQADERQRSQAVITRTRSRAVPQGVYPARLLAARLAEAPADAGAIEGAIRETPSYGEVRSREVREPWKVVITCPEVDADGSSHRVTFTGTGEPEPAISYGTPADGWDVVMEDAATTDLVPPRALERAEWRLRLTLVVEGIVAAALLAITWASGALALAARETPGWLALALTLAAGALVFGAVALYGPRGPEGNANDMLVLRRFYESRIETLWWAGMISGALFVAALVTAVVPPVLLRDEPVPAPEITFDATDRPVTATVSLLPRDVGSDDTIVVVMRQYAEADGEPTLVGRVSATGDATGTTAIQETVALDDGARYLAVLVTIEGHEGTSTCTPASSVGPGCTVVSVPPLGAGVVRALTTIVVQTEATPSVAPSPSPVTEATPTASPTP